jgi:predicted membrane channel-forming protein YqfA (hemolysin III family)
MSLLWIILFCVVALMWVLSIVDIVRQHYSGSTTVAWLALIVILPIVGSIIYWFARKPTREDAEQQYLADADRRRGAASRPFDGTGMGP